MIAGVLLVQGVAAGSAADPIKTGEAFPDLAQFGLEGALPNLKGKVVLLDFWASWCGPCKRSFPVMKELEEKYGPRGFQVVAVSVDEKASAMASFLKKEKPSFVVLRDSEGRLARAAQIEAMPTSFLIGSDGRVLSVHSGFTGESTRKKYISEIEAALPAANP